MGKGSYVCEDCKMVVKREDWYAHCKEECSGAPYPELENGGRE